LGQPRLTKAMKTTATAERVTTTTALKAKIEPRVTNFYERCQMSDGVCAPNEACVFIASIKGHLANRCSRRKPCEAGCTLKHHRLLHQPGTKEMTPVRDQIAAEDHRSSEDGKTPDHAVLLAKSTTRKNILLQTAN
ncbi:hypothetical protein T05_14423, partial [Trichinella murrelli]